MLLASFSHVSFHFHMTIFCLIELETKGNFGYFKKWRLSFNRCTFIILNNHILPLSRENIHFFMICTKLLVPLQMKLWFFMFMSGISEDRMNGVNWIPYQFYEYDLLRYIFELGHLISLFLNLGDADWFGKCLFLKIQMYMRKNYMYLLYVNHYFFYLFMPALKIKGRKINVIHTILSTKDCLFCLPLFAKGFVGYCIDSTNVHIMFTLLMNF